MGEGKKLAKAQAEMMRLKLDVVAELKRAQDRENLWQITRLAQLAKIRRLRWLVGLWTCMAFIGWALIAVDGYRTAWHEAVVFEMVIRAINCGILYSTGR